MQAHVTLRGSVLSGKEKKRVILDSDNSLEGKLTMVKVREAVRMLGASFFQEMAGVNRKVSKSKVYDQSTLVTEETEQPADHEEFAHATHHEDWAEDEFIDSLVGEGDEDAVFVSDFETAATDVIQSDEDLASAFSTYIEARRKLSEKYLSGPLASVQRKRKSLQGEGERKIPLEQSKNPATKNPREQLPFVWTKRTLEERVPSQGSHLIQCINSSGDTFNGTLEPTSR